MLLPCSFRLDFAFTTMRIFPLEARKTLLTAMNSLAEALYFAKTSENHEAACERVFSHVGMAQILYQNKQSTLFQQLCLIFVKSNFVRDSVTVMSNSLNRAPMLHTKTTRMKGCHFVCSNARCPALSSMPIRGKSTLNRCRKCHLVRYCNATCQREDWPTRRLFCGRKGLPAKGDWKPLCWEENEEKTESPDEMEVMGQ
ncbi:hypothetical protein M427DRAFT_352835 [Gonapodya prolifera JEL478]|uniref:MYND-type domain-containing protein n=1 Tax=Gonapodya prolifera (strain JEL478) TaxID=1344416 RepID=A0A139ABZ3_GONPJ|nr:hypothetical protein M427DRAFT_352835 [Gonapodya prolifera JEL478]|eukprot:KXS14277.1 hypothetical protein M427DRAFT_352835 [Gonapodya prolifera JEL478]